MNTKKARKAIILGVIAFFMCVTCALGVLRWDIQSDLNKWCDVVQATYPHPGDDVAALLEYVQSDSHSLENRNHIIWALGQARDSQALPVLESFYTGEKCDHNQYLCQGELEKAIKLCKGETPNILYINMP